MPMTKLVIINYHYVGMPKMPYDGIHGLSLEEFQADIEYISSRAVFISLKNIEELSVNKKTLSTSSCLLTFDDGLRCQFEVVLPFLRAHNIPAVFFVSSDPIVNRLAAANHKLQWIRANIGDVQVEQMINKIAKKVGISTVPIELDQTQIKQSYRYDNTQAARIKYYMNYFLNAASANIIIAELLQELDVSEEQFVNDFYMSKQMLKELALLNMLGSHAQSHRPLAKLSSTEAMQELKESKEQLEKISGVEINNISYPLGSPEAVNENTADLARKAGYKLGFTMTRKAITQITTPLLIPRIDAKDIKSFL